MTSSSQCDRLSSYSRLAVGLPMLGVAAASGLTESASADLQIWSVGQTIPYSTSGGLTLTASFNSNFKIGFFYTGAGSGTWADAWAPNANLGFIYYSSEGTESVALWAPGVTFGLSALNGQSSAAGNTTHGWAQAPGNNTDAVELGVGFSNVGADVVVAMGIRFESGSDFHYGWVEMSLGQDGLITIHRWAVESDAGVGADYAAAGGGAVPGIGGLAALACGAAGVRRKRSRTA